MNRQDAKTAKTTSTRRRSLLELNMTIVIFHAMLLGSLWIGSVFASDAATEISNSKKEVPLIRLERFHSCGSCPAYEVAIYRDGQVRYFGKTLVNRQGAISSEISARNLDALISKFEQIKFFEMDDKYPTRFMDGALVELQFIGSLRRKTIQFHTSFSAAPPELISLANQIDELLGVRAWVCPSPTSPTPVMCR